MMSWVKLPTPAIIGEAVRGLILLGDRQGPVLGSMVSLALGEEWQREWLQLS